MVLVLVKKHLYNNDESQGSSGKEEDSDIFFKIMQWMKNDSHAPLDRIYLFLTVLI